jgi:mannose-6-phosphate isomerase-like protein (cupin superfamily)
MESNEREPMLEFEQYQNLGVAELSYDPDILTTVISPRPPIASRAISPSEATQGWDRVEQIIDRNQLLAIIISQEFNKPGTHFFTPNDLSQQLGYMRHPAGKIVQPHIHQPIVREVRHTQEVLFIKKGKLRVDLYNDRQQYLQSRVLKAGDAILLATGGHGFEVLEEIEMIEVKQGPYVGNRDLIHFEGISTAQANTEE